MIINLLMGDKKAKEDGNRYILCDAVLLVGRYLDELKWAVVHDFFEEEKIPFTAVTHSKIPEIDSFDPTQATVVIFEDLMDAPKKIQDLITGYFTHGRHKNISCIYVAQRFFAIPKAIQENVNYISLHGGHGSLTDTKIIIRLYTEESESLAPVKVACRNLFGLMPKGETSYIVPKRRNAETAKPVKIAKLPKHAETSIIGFSVVSA
ncbi:hypothetical protein RIR_jg30707.t1 [Rhizophagus irregularis DAOM 181602=DAOM 197198]|nr:hypothetical protein RIR_jg30707.t1 [Rhizophagus irregularis DAOM 181602=DAOM 197198]